MSNANGRELNKLMRNMEVDEQRAIAMALPTNILFEEVQQRLNFYEEQNRALRKIAKTERTYETVEKINAQRERTVDFESLELDGLGEGKRSV